MAHPAHQPTPEPRPPAARRAAIAAFAGLPLFGWLGYLIDATYEDLWHFGTDRTAISGLVTLLCVLTGLAYLLLAISALAGVGWSRWLVLGLAAPAVVCGLYTVVLGGSHTYRHNPPSPATVMFFGLVATGYALAMIAAVRHRDILIWIESRAAAAAGKDAYQ